MCAVSFRNDTGVVPYEGLCNIPYYFIDFLIPCQPINLCLAEKMI